MATASAKQVSSKSDTPRKQRPVWSKGFPVTVAVFEFPSANGDGPPNHSVRLTRSFRRDDESNWENSEFLSGGNDCLRGAKLLESADAFIQSRLDAYHQSRKAERNAAETGDSF